MKTLLFIALGYLLGSIPTAYVVSRWKKKIDLRRYGSGTVSGSMVYEHVGHLMVVPVGLFDIAKGAVPTWLALQANTGLLGAVLAGLAAVLGHNWPLYLGFVGGRGLSPFMGMLLVTFPWGDAWLLGFLAVGFFLGDSAPWALASLALMPLLVNWMHAPAEITAGILGMIFLTVFKRLEANGRPLPDEFEARRKVLLLRLFFDRDIVDHQAWIRRTPENSAAEKR